MLLTGTTGSGKSTTLAAMIDHMNHTMSKHIVTIEDPIEFVHTDKRSAINQREVGMDTASFKRALRRVLRQDPDVILVGEMRDEETVQTALSAAETGHLVLSTIHTVDATESINRMLDFFPPHQHQQARSMIAGTVKGVISQRLVPGADGGRVAVCEILRMTGRVRDMILDPDQTGQTRRGDHERRLLRHADLRPGAVRPRQGRPRDLRGRDARRLEPPRLQAADAGRRSRGHDDGGRRLSREPSAKRPRSPSSAARRLRAARSPQVPGRAAPEPLALTSFGKVKGEMAVDETCPVCLTAEIVCSKWTLLLVRDLSEGRSRFCELERSLAGISPRTLSLRLRALEEEGIVERQTFPEVPPRVEYALTEKGRALLPIIDDMRAYGEDWLGVGCAERAAALDGRARRRLAAASPPAGSRAARTRCAGQEREAPGRSRRQCARCSSRRALTEFLEAAAEQLAGRSGGRRRDPVRGRPARAARSRRARRSTATGR